MPPTTTVVMVKRIITDWDCRRVYALQAIADRNRLGPREVVLAFNTRLTMARVVDASGSILTIYADPGHEFVLDTLFDGREETFGISFRESRTRKVVPFRRPKKKAA